VIDWEPPQREPRSGGERALLIAALLGVSVVITGMTLFGATLAETFSWTSVGAWLRSGELPDGPAWLQAHFAALYLPLLAVAAAVRFGAIFLGTLWYERGCGEPLPTPYTVAMMLTNGLLFVLPFAVIGLLGFGATLFGLDFAEGSHVFRRASLAVSGAVERWVPTLVTIPYPWPLLAAMLPAGLGYYLWHRLQHAWRPLWLLSHRPHHVAEHLALPTTLPADSPLAFALNSIPQALLIGTLTQLFASEPMMLEAMLWVVVTWTFTEVFNHTEATYHWTMGGPVRRFWFHFFGCGAWHLVHHSSAEEHRLANLGGGPFLLWDRVFGTYHAPPAEKPRMGLTGRPPLRMSPFRLALSGHAELVEELARNRSWREWGRLLLGSARYRPPVRVDHLTREAGAPRAGEGAVPA
jgi:sterol desaturase/sphingolipid hydroxylase (fatty acid hydroxylase superfamily)